MKPTVSVILPFYNADNTLEKAIESILCQNFKAFELILVDNNSSDNSNSISKLFAKKDSRIQLIKEEKQGVAHAMNCGLTNSIGKYVSRMDADDFAHPEKLSKQIKFLRNNPQIDFVGSEVNYIPQNSNTDGFKRFVDWANSFHTSTEIEQNRFIEIPIINPTILFKKELFEKYGGCLDGNFPEDYEMQLRYLKAGVKMAKIKEPLLDWYDYSTRLTRTEERYSTEAFFKIKAKYFKSWSEKNNSFHPKIWIWGAGRKTRQRANLLEKEGFKIVGFIDIIKGKTSKKTILHYTEIPIPGETFIVSMVTNYGAREKIKDFLLKANYVESEDFVLMG